MEWHPQVHKRSAIKEGRVPEDFQFEQWPLSNLRMRLGDHSKIDLWYECDIPADTPQANQYVEDKSERTGWRALPDPVGMALSRVVIELQDAKTYEVLHKSTPDHTDGHVQGGLSRRSQKTILWERLTPGTHLRVRLAAKPMFYFLKEDGSMAGHYADAGHRGYFVGKEIESEVYVLALTEDGDLLLNG